MPTNPDLSKVRSLTMRRTTAKQALVELARSAPEDLSWEEAHCALFLWKRVQQSQESEARGECYTPQELLQRLGLSPEAGRGAKLMDLSVELEQEVDGRWIAEVVELPGVLVYGDTPHEAIRAARVLSLQVLADRLAQGELTLHGIHFHHRDES